MTRKAVQLKAVFSEEGLKVKSPGELIDVCLNCSKIQKLLNLNIQP
ncbi:MAG: hypothetical protein ACYSTX_01710 [Planctomycetota bacterium]|jgi:hypothetical protein